MGIRMVSDKEGEQIRKDTEDRIESLRQLLIGAKVVDVKFKSVWMNIRPVNEIILEKDGRVFSVEDRAESSWEGSVLSWLEITDVKTREILSDEEP